MVRSPRSRGKGGRRYPGRPGGLKRGKTPGNWERRCQHRIEDINLLPQPWVELWYNGNGDTELEHRAYLFDQAMAKCGIFYVAILGARYRHWALLIRVREADSQQVAGVIKRLERR